MREILFRGKSVLTGEWIYGDFRHGGIDKETNERITFIKPFDKFMHEVIPETVGQYTGLTDKNGKKIFEGDCFRDESEGAVAVVIFKDGCFRLQWYGLCGTYTESGYDECGGGWGIFECEPVDYRYVYDMEIIGNIHDNPELLKGGVE